MLVVSLSRWGRNDILSIRIHPWQEPVCIVGCVCGLFEDNVGSLVIAEVPKHPCNPCASSRKTKVVLRLSAQWDLGEDEGVLIFLWVLACSCSSHRVGEAQLCSGRRFTLIRIAGRVGR